MHVRHRCSNLSLDMFFSRHGTFNRHSTDSDKLLVHLQKRTSSRYTSILGGRVAGTTSVSITCGVGSAPASFFFLISSQKKSPGSSLGLTSVHFQNWAYRRYISIFRSAVGTFPYSRMSSVHFQIWSVGQRSYRVCVRYFGRRHPLFVSHSTTSDSLVYPC